MEMLFTRVSAFATWADLGVTIELPRFGQAVLMVDVCGTTGNPAAQCDLGSMTQEPSTCIARIESVIPTRICMSEGFQRGIRR